VTDRLTPAMIDAALQELWSGRRTAHPLDQVADHFEDHCACMVLLPQDTWTMAHVSARMPMHPLDAARILQLRGAYCGHPQLAGWRLFELALPGGPVVFPWPPALTDRELGEHLRSLASRRTGHDPALISIRMPHRDCPRHSAPPVELTPPAVPA
jgi:hypothetical protein